MYCALVSIIRSTKLAVELQMDQRRMDYIYRVLFAQHVLTFVELINSSDV